MLNIDNKIYRTLQEEVGHLATTVQEIIDVTDADVLAGYVNQMSDWSNTMNDWSNTMNGYANTMGDYATTMNGYSNTMNNYANTMAGYASQVNTWTNNISGAAVAAVNAANIKPLTIEQVNTSYDMTYNITGGPTGLTRTAIYNKAHKVNRELCFILNVKLENNSGSSITVAAGSNLLAGSCAYASIEDRTKIFDYKGKYLGESGASSTIISTAIGTVSPSDDISTSSGLVTLYLANNSSESRQFDVRVKNNSAITIPDGSAIFVSVRTSLFI